MEKIRVMRRFFIFIFMALWFVLFPGAALLKAADIEIPDGNTPLNGTLSLPILINNAPNDVSAFGFEFRYDATVLAYQSYDIGGHLGGLFTNFEIGNPSAGVLRGCCG